MTVPSRMLVAALLALALLGAASSDAKAAESVVYTRGTFDRTNYVPYELWIANEDGSGQRQIPVGSHTAIASPTLSPNGREVAFSRLCASGCGGISVADVYSGQERVIVSDPAAGTSWVRPVFSPDGRTLLLTKRVIGPHPDYVDQFSIYRVNADGTGLSELVGWRDSSGRPDQLHATFSPDGTKIAFSSAVTPQGVRERGRTLWIANADASSPRQLTVIPEIALNEPGNDVHDFGDRPTFSPSGDQLAFQYHTLDNPEPYSHYDVDLYRVNSDGSGLVGLTGTPDIDEGAPSWSSAGKIAFTPHGHSGTEPWEIHTIASDGSGKTKLIGDPLHGYGSPSFGPWAPATDTQLLAQYGPLLRNDAQETYLADSAATITDNCLLDSRGRIVRTNYLKDSSNKILAASCGGRYALLSLGYLGSYARSSTHLIDEANTYAEDAQRLHGVSGYANKTYGRVVNTSDGGKVLQYWLFYYYNPKEYPPVVGAGEHEGDWEMVQVQLDAAQRPLRATYAQHGGGERCDWSHVQRTEDGRPIVYVAEGSHASYFSSGYHFNEGANDTSGGDGVVAAPTIVDVTVPPNWISWPGRWGGSDTSPRGPERQTDKWYAPVSWSTSVDGCTEGQTQALAARTMARRASPDRSRARRLRPPPPTVTAARRGKQVVIRYSFARPPAAKPKRPGQIISSIDPRGTRYPPLTVRTAVNGRKGTIVQPLGAGDGPFRILVRAVGRSGVRSSKVSLRLR